MFARLARQGLFTALGLVVACASDYPSSLTPRALSQAIPDTPSAGYLSAYMTSDDERSLYYAVSIDGRHFEALNGGRAVLHSTLDDQLLRDPMLFRDQRGRYHLVATISWTHRAVVMWDSYDLVHWKNERLIHTGPATSTKAWAPEIAYDEQRDQYALIVTADEGDWETTAIYAQTTVDFESFSAPTLLYRDSVNTVIDPTIVVDSGVYHLFYRGDGILQATAKDLMGPYAGLRQVTPELLEGPAVFRQNDGSGWTLLLDNWQDSSGYTVMASPDLNRWTRLTNPTPPRYNGDVSFPAGVRHGSVIRVSQEQIDSLKSAFDSPAHPRKPR